MDNYTSFEQIEKDLKRYKLERDIAWEELKLMKNEYKEDLKPMNWVSTAIKITSKYSFIALLRKWIFK
ncbi:DUF6327 family protein [Winogradskyella sp. SYSU M77433]|uniref:DUF6327 family protein n=1 Tax=Winogradskyella sp. SYSU M77433 TaxID=3042722 RepID=UPI0024805C3F|nr:DUF6327 family protein [Winogradskyella sp. SYSU M77433]MDH7912894.1 DUF6327 family protein [Winogradskyella sp. SYSU M77433]